ncbi:MAG: hypothetical protein ACJA0H_001720 [Francisellaceae bacterium]|jgi:uncharacterized protein YbjQ (UPF0145 family)
MLAVTTNEIPGKTIIEVKGMVHGIVVRTPTIGQGILGGLKSLIGGGNKSYGKMCEQTRNEAYKIMLTDAQLKGANAIVAVRYDSDSIGGATTANEVFCFGTAVVIK